MPRTAGGEPLAHHHAIPPPTPRLAFRQMAEDDLDDMAALLGDPTVMRYHPRPKSRQEALAWIDWNQRLHRQEGPFGPAGPHPRHTLGTTGPLEGGSVRLASCNCRCE
ncbi:GNAT family N-acetyltransferase [Streptomyces sp. NBC_01431]|uniref:GNAT family N-acetyltransferase n=1 Tax=Streptomyces sp. NBC_01431 TaxID=2903863 RepID=UPI003FCEBEF0